MRKSKPRQKRAAPKRSAGKSTQLFINRVSRWIGRVNWPSITLRGAALIALVAVETAVAIVVGKHAGDPITTVILVSTAILGGVGVVLGPQVALRLRSKPLQRLAWLTVVACFVVSLWNLTTTLHNASDFFVAEAIRSADTYEGDVARLAHLNRLIDGLADETGYNQAADQAYANNIAERDRLQARIDRASPEPVVISDNLAFWLKAFLFHGLVLGFSACFSIPMKPRRKMATKRAKKTAAPRGEPGFPAAVNF